MFEDSQLTGAFIVDPAGAPPPPDRIFILGGWAERRLTNGDPDFNRFFGTINGRPWPHQYTVSRWMSPRDSTRK